MRWTWRQLPARMHEATSISRLRRGLRRLAVLLCSVCILVPMGLGAYATPVAASAPSGSCSAPPISVINVAPGLSSQEVCGIFSLETEAYDMYAAGHGMQPGDPRIAAVGQAQIAGIAWQLLQDIAFDHANDPTQLTSDMQGAYQWFYDIVSGYQLGSAQDAIQEYDKWNARPCLYLPPSTKLFTFRGSDDPTCSAQGEANMLFGPTPPTYEEFLEYGQYDANQALMTATSLNAVNEERFAEAQASWAALLLGGAPQVVNSFELGPSTILTITHRIMPDAKIQYAFKMKLRAVEVKEKLQALEEEQKLQSEGQPEDTVIAEEADTADTEAWNAGLDITDTFAAEGADFLSGPMMVVGFAAAVLAQQSIKISAEQKIPGQLQDNLNAVKTSTTLSAYLTDLLQEQSGGGYALASQLFEDQLNLPAPNSLPGSTATTPPDDGTGIKVSYVDGNGNTTITTYNKSVTIASWPLGIDQGAGGVPAETIELADGLVWHTPNPDEAAAGLKGFLASGELHYYDWAGRPRLAILDGNQFVDMPSPGSIDLGGYDVGDYCATSASCTVTDTLDALLPGEAVTPSITRTSATNLDMTYTTLYTPSDGSLVPSTIGTRIRLTIAPDQGTPASISTFVQGAPVSASAAVGQTMDLTDPSTSLFGYATSYTWQIETQCPYDAAHPPEVVQGVPVCYGSPDYGQSSLAADEQDLSQSGTEDPAFHGDPVSTMTGQSIQFAWPAPGTYHVRLITKDTYGRTKQSDMNVMVAGSAPSIPLTSSVGWSGASVIGPIPNGHALTLSGCIQSVDGSYARPQVTVDWGDGSAAETIDTVGQAGGLTLAYGASGCSQPWSFTATHTYSLTPPAFGDQIQVPLTLTVADGYGQSTTLKPYAEVQFVSKPAITSPASTVFAADSLGFFRLSATGEPVPALSITSGSLPSGLGFVDLGNGTASLSGTPSQAEGGLYPLTVAASNSQGTVTQSFTLNIDSQPAVTSAAADYMSAGQAGTYAITASGYPTPALSIQGQLPSGVSFQDNGDGTATLSGTAAAGTSATFPLAIVATNSAGSTTQAFHLTVGSNPAFTSGTTANFETGGSPASFLITTSGFPAPALSMTGTLPAGLAFHDNGNGTAEIYGSPTASTTSTVTITATSSGGTATQSLTVNASATGGSPITLSGSNFDASSDQGEFLVGQSGSITVTSSVYTLGESGALPAGITFTNNGDGTATISGTPSVAGSYGTELTTGDGGYAFLTILVFGPPSVTSSSTADFTSGIAGSFTVSTSSWPAASLSFSGTLPTGLTFQDNGDGTATIAGTPTVTGTYPITLSAENLYTLGSGAPTQSTLTIDVSAPPSVTSATYANFGAGAAGSFTVTTSGSPSPTLQLTGTLPSGLTFSDQGNGTGSLSGTPAAGTLGDYPVTVTASSPAGMATQSLDVVVGALPSITSQPAAAFQVGQASAFTVQTTAASSLALTGSLPTGLTFTDNGDGTATIAGTPAVGTGGQYAIPVTATNAYGSTSQNVQLTVDEAPTITGTPIGLTCSSAAATPSMTFTAGALDDWQLCATGYPLPALNLSGPLPPGLAFSDAGDGSASIQGVAINGTGISQYPLTLRAQNSSGTASQDLTLTLDDQPQVTSGQTATFLPGQPNSFTMTAFGNPTPAFTPIMTPPAWMTFTDNGDGTATVTGVPPASAMGTTVNVPMMIANGAGNGVPALLAVDVSPLDQPTPATLATPYSFDLSSTAPGDAFALAAGDSLPDGLSLSATGQISGTPTAVGTWEFGVVVSGGTSMTVPVTLTVNAGSAHPLEISKFRVTGPTGPDDWFVQVENTTTVPISLFGWRVNVIPARGSAPIGLALGGGTLNPGGTVIVAGPYSSLSPQLVDSVGPSAIANPGGFAVVAPDGTVTDAAGEAGAAATLRDGAGVVPPQGSAVVAQDAFVRDSVSGQLVDTGDNAADFTYASVADLQSPDLTGLSTTLGPVGTPLTLTGTSFGSTAGTLEWTPASGSVVTQTIPQTDWSDTTISTTVPSGLQPGSVSLAVYNATTGPSQTLDFTVSLEQTIATPPSTAVTMSVYGSGGTAATSVGVIGFAGTVDVAEYTGNPAQSAPPSFAAGGGYFDVKVSSPTFTPSAQLTISQCTGVQQGDRLYWLNASTWQAVAPASGTSYTFANSCLSVTLDNATSSPLISQLNGTVFAVANPPAAATGSPLAAPTVTAVSPSTGPQAGGTPVTITGTNLAGATQIAFGGQDAGGVTVVSDTTITAIAPAGSGTVDVTVTTPVGTSQTSAADRFTYAATAPEFSDVPSTYWAYAQINALVARGIVSGFPDGTYRPDAAVTRAQFVKMLVLVLGLKPAAGKTGFADVPASSWFAPYVAAAVGAGITEGLTQTSFGPDQRLTREQIAVMLARALQLSKAGSLNFTDAAHIAAWAKVGVEEAVAAGLLSGYPDGSFRPATVATRAQIAKVLASVLTRGAN